MKRILFFIIVFLTSNAFSQMQYSTEKVAQNLGVVWGFDFISDTTIIFTEKSGKIGLFNTISKNINYLKLPRVLDNLYASGQGGLLDIQIHPSNWIYLTSSREYGGEISTVLSRFQIKNKQIENFADIFITQTGSDSGYHFGSRITFDKTHLYFSIGDRGDRDSAQNLALHNGSILRLELDGSTPTDNPLRNQKNALPEIYSYGHRNPQGLFFDTTTQKLWSIEHGPRGGDEINLITAGKNYGWPIISYGKEYWAPISVGEGTHKAGMEQPIKYFIPSIAPSDLLIYSGKKNEQLTGAIISSALALKHINIIHQDKEIRILTELNQRIRSIAENKQGVIYFTTDNGNMYTLTLIDK